MHTVLDYPMLRIIWWGLLGILFIAFTLTDGWDLGIGTLLPFVARSDTERRMVINCAGPTWEGNQVWFITGGAAIFAAWPFVYAVTFSGFYAAMFLVLAALILRPVGFKYRSKRLAPRWRTGWDWALFVGGFVPSLVFGVAVGNVLQGLPFHLDSDLRTHYEGSFFGLFTPFTLLCGLLAVAMIVLHGAAYLTVKLEPGAVQDRSRLFGSVAAIVSMILFACGWIFVRYGSLGFHVTGAVPVDGASNPLRTTTEPLVGAWLTNYAAYPWMTIAPVLGFIGALLALIGIRSRSGAAALGGSALSALGIIATVGLSMFPFIVPSTIDAHSSLTVWNSSSSESTLFLMLIVTTVFLPLVLAYTAWVYRVLWGRVTRADIASNPDLY